MFKVAFSVYLLAVATLAAPPHLGLKFDKGADGLPTLTLPYASYRATRFNPNGGIYVFKNIRYAAPPVGDLRWAKPAPPTPESGVQDGSYGPICIQAPMGGSDPAAANSSSAGEGLPTGGTLPSTKPTSEDCLFLDIYVPKKAIDNPSVKLPVISWYHGGSYVFGAKDQVEPILPLYDGTGLLQQSEGNVIFIASNYRLGAYGFLAGNTIEKTGLPNAGLYDQRAVLQWIQSYISLLGGDKTQVSAWGESAGAGSILHQLVAFGGTQDPLFSRAVLQSPAFNIAFDRKGKLEQTFQKYATLAGCAGQSVACLRAASPETLEKANKELGDAVGPSTDGNLIRQLAALEFASGNYNRLPTSFIFSHVSNEAELFIPPAILTDPQFTAYIDAMFPAYAKAGGINAVIEAHYPPTSSPSTNYTTNRARLRDYINEASFSCNVRYLSDAYAGKNYNLQYSVTPGLHATDLFPTFYNLNLDLDLFRENVPFPLIPGFGAFSQAYQSYLTSLARTGDPNIFKRTVGIPPAISWPKAENSAGRDVIGGVLDAGDLGFRLINDEQTRRSRCGFWRDIQAAVTGLGGYAPPGSVVGQNLVPVQGDPSRNFGS
ncbi:MAG: hypothetical protein Q9169_005205 [Polycauliona sp. 2 TL-2023]